MNIMRNHQKTLILIIVVFFWFAQYVYIPYQTPYLNLVHVSSNLIGTIVGAYGISQLVLRLPVGIMADISSNHKFFILIGTLCAGLASLFRIFLSPGIGFFIGNILSGIASATWISFMVLYMGYFSKGKQAIATSNIILANNLGMLLGFVTSTFLYDIVGMRMVCVYSFIAGMIGYTLSFFLNPTIPANGQKLTILDLLTVGKDKNLLVFSFLALIQQGVQMSSTMSFTNQIIKGLGANNTMVGLSSIIYMLSAVLFAKAASTRFIEKIATKHWIYSIFCCLGFYCFQVSHTSSIGTISLLQIIPGMATGILFSLVTSEAMQTIDPHKRSTAMGFFQAIYAIGMTVFPIISGILYQRISIQATYSFLALSCLIAVILSALYFHSAARKTKLPKMPLRNVKSI
ncbi:MFS transporter [Neobacillus sp. Marseille-QA0830]